MAVPPMPAWRSALISNAGVVREEGEASIACSLIVKCLPVLQRGDKRRRQDRHRPVGGVRHHHEIIGKKEASGIPPSVDVDHDIGRQLDGTRLRRPERTGFWRIES
jgi:hypothetical protein